MTPSPTPRSYLFVPGTRPDRFPKALASGADQVIIDLEDAVADARKPEARDALTRWLTDDARVAVRINGPLTPWFGDDLEACRHPGVVAVAVGKTEDVDTVRLVADRVGSGTAILPFIETARGLTRAEAIAGSPGVRRLVFGSIDFQLDLGIHGEDDGLLVFRSHLVLASRLAGVEAPVDGVTTTFETPDAVETDARRARRLGFGAKLCIHPTQVPVVNACFSPSADEIAWARRVVEADRQAGGDAVALQGEMVDRPVLSRARAILARA